MNDFNTQLPTTVDSDGGPRDSDASTGGAPGEHDGAENAPTEQQPGAQSALVPFYELSETEQDDAIKGIYAVSAPAASNQILQTRWGVDYEANIKFATSVGVVPGAQAAWRVLEIAGVDQHPDIIAVMASFGRMLAKTPGDPTSVQPPTNHQSQKETRMSDDDFDDRIDQLQDQKMAAMHAGNQRKALRIDKQQQDLQRRQFGNGPGVGSAGRTA